MDKSERRDGMMARTGIALDDLDSVLGDPQVSAGLQHHAPAIHAAASGFWNLALGPGLLSPRMKELILVALHATATALDAEAVDRHVRRALEAGASELDVLDVLLTITGAANHALYFAVPVLMEELKSAGNPEPPPGALDPEVQAIKDEFVRTRGFWNEQRNPIAQKMPKYFAALSKVATASWQFGSLTKKERELVCIAIDCTVTHMYRPGLVIHIRAALEAGAAPQEILEVFQLASVIGLEGYILGAKALFGK